MRRALVPLMVAALCLCGCGQSPKQVFGVLRDAAVHKDAKSIWANITPETQAELTRRAAQESESSPASSAAGPAYLETLAKGLDDEAVEYIKSLSVGQVTINGDTALMSLASFRFGSPGKTLVFRKVGKKWRWDARDILKAYVENRGNLEAMGGF